MAGQFNTQPPDVEGQQARMQDLAKKHSLDPNALITAAEELTVLSEHQRTRFVKWLEGIACAFGQVGHDRKESIKKYEEV